MRKIGTFAVAAAVAALGFSAMPGAEAQFSSGKNEIARAARLEWLDLKKHAPREPDPAVQAYVQCVANSIIATLDAKTAKEFDWEVVVFDNPEVNAFANPEGKIGVFNGMLSIADTPEMLAAVLGHEIAHATEGHVLSRARRGVLVDLGAVLAGAAVPQISQGDIQQGAAVGLMYPYARDQESEADEVGLVYMAKAGYDPRAALDLWKGMRAANEGKPQPASFMSTHPADDIRMHDIVSKITPALIEYNDAREAGRRPNCAIPRRR
jgi:predicted Zn-dependent protease